MRHCRSAATRSRAGGPEMGSAVFSNYLETKTVITDLS